MSVRVQVGWAWKQIVAGIPPVFLHATLFAPKLFARKLYPKKLFP